jgi:hypothetical protein
MNDRADNNDRDARGDDRQRNDTGAKRAAADHSAGPDQRHDPRVTAEHQVRLTVSLHGFDRADQRYEAKGATVNLSHRGALMRVDRRVEEGSRCLVYLPGGDERLGKSLIYGTVVRTRDIDDGFEIAIEFDTRLPEISLEDSLD